MDVYLSVCMWIYLNLNCAILCSFNLCAVRQDKLLFVKYEVMNACTAFIESGLMGSSTAIISSERIEHENMSSH